MAALRNYTLKLNPSEKNDFGLRGNTVRVITAGCTVYFETKDGNNSFYLVEGEQANFDTKEFLTLTVYHLEVTEQTIVLALGEDAEIGSAKISGNVVVTSGSVTISNFAALNGAFTQGRVSLTNVNQAIVAANANRRKLLIQNNDVGAVMRVNVAGVAATEAQGFRILAGDSLELTDYLCTGAINAIMETATGAAGNVEFAEG